MTRQSYTREGRSGTAREAPSTCGGTTGGGALSAGSRRCVGVQPTTPLRESRESPTQEGGSPCTNIGAGTGQVVGGHPPGQAEHGAGAALSISEEGASPGHPQPAGPVAILRGMTARQLKRPQSENPFEEGTAERLLWLYGWGRKAWPRVRGGPQRDASCETSCETAPERNARTGPYSALDDEVLALTWGHLPREEIGCIIGRNVAQVSNRALRLGLSKGDD